MPRPSQFPAESILRATADIASEQGPGAATISAIADRLGAPTGSIYHRFKSRDILLAELWLQTVETFQSEFCALLDRPEPRDAGLDAALYTPRWVREHEVPARLLLLHSRDDFIRGQWPEEVATRGHRLGDGMSRALRGFSRRALGQTTAAAIRRAQFAVIDVPAAAVRPHLRAEQPVPAAVDDLVREAYHAVIPPAPNRS